jgi:Flp pilus assembly protein TadB
VWSIIFALILCVLYQHAKDENRRKLANLMNKQVIEALTVIKNTAQEGQSLQDAFNIVKNELKIL